MPVREEVKVRFDDADEGFTRRPRRDVPTVHPGVLRALGPRNHVRQGRSLRHHAARAGKHYFYLLSRPPAATITLTNRLRVAAAHVLWARGPSAAGQPAWIAMYIIALRSNWLVRFGLACAQAKAVQDWRLKEGSGTRVLGRRVDLL